MSEKDDGGPAFPTSEHDDATGAYHEMHGMSLRDWFAGQALVPALMGAKNLGSLSEDERKLQYSAVAALLYEMADAMLVERSK